MNTTSDQGVKLIMEREGCVLKPYQDSVGVWTDGVGNTHGVVPGGPPITMEKAMADLKRNLAGCEAAINSGVKCAKLEQHQFDALASFAFNVGEGAFLSSTLLRKINLGDMDGAAREFDRWHIPAGITSRRNGEREQFKGTAFEARINEETVA
jgi:lysozyme